MKTLKAFQRAFETLFLIYSILCSGGLSFTSALPRLAGVMVDSEQSLKSHGA